MSRSLRLPMLWLLLCAALPACRAQPARDIVAPGGARPGSVRAEPGRTRRICQLIREQDAADPRIPVANHTERRTHLAGTDLGVSFAGPEPGTIHFLFGDSVPLDQRLHAVADDAVAVAARGADPEHCVPLRFYSDAHGDYRPIRLDGAALGIFDVPTSAFVVQGRTYATFATAAGGTPRRPTRSVLGVNARFPRSLDFRSIAELPAARMTNVSTALVDDAWRRSEQPTQVLLFGTGTYRAAPNVYLAVIRLAELRRGAALRLHWFGARSAPGQADWSSDPQRARGIFDTDGAACMGELSVTWNPYLGRWLMLYNCSAPRGILYRVASRPWGPWSAPQVLFEPRADHGYCVFIHDEHPERDCPPGSPNPGDELITREHGSAAYGGEYAPYVIEAFTRGDRRQRRTRIYFTLSTWNPYTVMLMSAQLSTRD